MSKLAPNERKTWQTDYLHEAWTLPSPLISAKLRMYKDVRPDKTSSVHRGAQDVFLSTCRHFHSHLIIYLGCLISHHKPLTPDPGAGQ